MGLSKPRLLSLLLILGFLLLGGLFWQAIHGFVSAIEVESLSFRQRLFSLPPKDRSKTTPISMITMDTKTSLSPEMLRLFGRPMSRSAPAYVIRFLKRAKPTSVLFDLSFNGGVHQNDLAGDQELVRSLQGLKNVQSVLYLDRKWGARDDFFSFPANVQQVISNGAVTVKGIEHFPVYQYNYSFQVALLPYPDLLLNSGMQFYSSRSSVTNTTNQTDNGSEADTSGDSRRWAPFSFYGGKVIPVITLGTVLQGQRQLALSADGYLSWPGGVLNLGNDGLPLIKWYGHGVQMDKPVYPEFSFWDAIVSEIVLECRENQQANKNAQLCQETWLPKSPPLNPELFQGRYVVIGETLRSSDDVHKTIYGLRYSGVYILTNTLDNILHNDFVHPAPAWVNIGLFLALPLTLWLLALRYKSVLMSLLITVTLALGVFILGIYAYNELNLWVNTTYPILGVLLFFIATYLYRYWQEQRLRQQLRYAFGKYVSPAVMQWIERHPERLVLGGERREMTFLFCDIQGFTSYADTHPAEEVQAVLSSYFSVMNHIILHDCEGSINKLMGDAIMAYWGFPIQTEEQAVLAVSAALRMMDALKTWRNQPGNPPLDIRIGIHTGEAIVGNVGSEEFMDFTVIGDAVNIAARLESANKDLGTHILVSSETYERIRHKVQAKPLGEIKIRGRESSVLVYEPYGLL